MRIGIGMGTILNSDAGMVFGSDAYEDVGLVADLDTVKQPHFLITVLEYIPVQ